MLTAIKHYLSEGLLLTTTGVGEVGELTASILLSRAFDAAMRDLWTNTYLKVPTPVLLQSFLQHLYGTKYDELGPARRQLLNGFVFITHYIKVNYSISACDDLKQFFQRGAVILGKDMEVGIDILIPIAIPKEAVWDIHDYSSYEISAVFVQVKNWSSKNFNSNDLAYHIMNNQTFQAVKNQNRWEDILFMIMGVGTSISSDRKKICFDLDVTPEAVTAWIAKKSKRPAEVEAGKESVEASPMLKSEGTTPPLRNVTSKEKEKVGKGKLYKTLKNNIQSLFWIPPKLEEAEKQGGEEELKVTVLQTFGIGDSPEWFQCSVLSEEMQKILKSFRKLSSDHQAQITHLHSLGYSSDFCKTLVESLSFGKAPSSLSKSPITRSVYQEVANKSFTHGDISPYSPETGTFDPSKEKFDPSEAQLRGTMSTLSVSKKQGKGMGQPVETMK